MMVLLAPGQKSDVESMGGVETKRKKKMQRKHNTQLLELHTLAGEEKQVRGPAGLYLSRAIGLAGRWERAYRPAYWPSSYYASSGASSLVPGAIDCLCSTDCQQGQGAGRGLAGCRIIDCRPSASRRAQSGGEARLCSRRAGDAQVCTDAANTKPMARLEAHRR